MLQLRKLYTDVVLNHKHEVISKYLAKKIASYITKDIEDSDTLIHLFVDQDFCCAIGDVADAFRLYFIHEVTITDRVQRSFEHKVNQLQDVVDQAA